MKRYFSILAVLLATLLATMVQLDSSLAQWMGNGAPICTTLYYQETPQLVSDGAGGAVIAWEDHRSDNADIYAQKAKGPNLSTSPAQNELNVPTSTDISVIFDFDVDETTIDNSTFVVNARSTGLHQGTITYDSLTKTAILSLSPISTEMAIWT